MLNLNPIINLFIIVMFSSVGLFKEVVCPEEPQCTLPNCFFAHHTRLNRPAETNKQSSSSLASAENNVDHQHPDPPTKRRRLNENNDESRPNGRSVPAATFSLPDTASRDVSPPAPRGPRRGDHTSSTTSATNTHPQSTSKAVEVSLNPRMLQKPPASHAVRMQLIKMIHEQMHRLNEEVRNGDHPSKATVQLSPQALITQALSEEEKLATDSPAVYSNVIKLRIVKLKKMKAAEWIEERLKQIARLLPVKASKETRAVSEPIDTDLTPDEEVAFLPRFFATQGPYLAGHGYVTELVSDRDIEEARRGVEAAQGWEQCDRCRTRFQVFPGRREADGALTSGGHCVHHPGKSRKPTAQDKQDKADRAVREALYTCCNEAVGVSGGCTTAATHVFKVSEAKRLALIMPFEKTPPKPTSHNPPTAVCLDCEMGYTTLGMELIRLTATSWPSGAALLDVLVRPLGEILDLNSRFSGVWPQDFSTAPPYQPPTPSKDPTPSDPRIPIVPSPATARSLLFNHLNPQTPLIGHALDNDLNTTRIIHPSIIDTVLLYPHPRGLPLRFGLKVLMKRHLDRDIQTGGTAGHDSSEDARAAGELVRLRVRERWKSMKRMGWTVKDGEFFPPESPLPHASTTSTEPIDGDAVMA